MTSRGLLLDLALSLVMWLLIAVLVVGAVHAQDEGPRIGVAVSCGASGCTERPQILADVQAEAEAAEIQPIELLGAMNSLWDAGLEVSPNEYLHPPVVVVPACDWPICGALGQRIFCVEAVESNHGRYMWNPTPVWNGEHAAGFLGFLPSTARRWGAVIGDRASEWNAAAAMIRAGAGSEFAYIAWGRC